MNAIERGHKAAERVDAHLELKTLSEALSARDTEIKAFAAKATEEIKSIGAISTETKNALEKLSEKGTDLAARMGEVEQKLASRGSVADMAAKSLGRVMVESDEFRTFRNITTKGSAAVQVKSVTSATTGAGAAGSLIVPDTRPGILAPAERPLTIRNLLLPGSTASNAIQYNRETGFTNAAAPVAEGSAVGQSDISFELITANVKAIGHMITASRQILDDVPALASYIDQRMLSGQALVEEDQILRGNGTGQNLAGILPLASAFRASEYSDVGDTQIDTIRRAALQVRMAHLVPTFVVMNPLDWAAIELTKDNDNRYIWINIQIGGTPQLWRLAVIETTAINPGEFLVGAGSAAQVFDREETMIELSTEHADYFARGLLAIRAYQRLALAVYRPESFVHGSFNPTDTTINA